MLEMHDRRARERRLALARTATTIEFAIAGLAVLLAPFLFVASPGFLGINDPPDLRMLGAVGPIIGLVWMIRIKRADPEACPSPYRYRDW